MPVYGQDHNSILFGESLEDDSTLYTLRFKALQEILSLETIIDFAETKIPHQAVYYEDLDLYVVEQSFEIEMGQPNSTIDISNLNHFKIIPNPASESAVVEIHFEIIEEGILELFNIEGKMIFSKNISGKETFEPLYLRHLESGTYFLKLRTDKGIATQKLVKI